MEVLACHFPQVHALNHPGLGTVSGRRQVITGGDPPLCTPIHRAKSWLCSGCEQRATDWTCVPPPSCALAGRLVVLWVRARDGAAQPGAQDGLREVPLGEQSAGGERNEGGGIEPGNACPSSLRTSNYRLVQLPAPLILLSPPLSPLAAGPYYRDREEPRGRRPV